MAGEERGGGAVRSLGTTYWVLPVLQFSQGCNYSVSCTFSGVGGPLPSSCSRGNIQFLRFLSTLWISSEGPISPEKLSAIPWHLAFSLASHNMQHTSSRPARDSGAPIHKDKASSNMSYPQEGCPFTFAKSYLLEASHNFYPLPRMAGHTRAWLPIGDLIYCYVTN